IVGNLQPIPRDLGHKVGDTRDESTRHVFGLQRTLRKPLKHGANMQTPHTEQRQESIPQPWRPEANMLTTNNFDNAISCLRFAASCCYSTVLSV
ncbi:hypothetical protein QTP70_020462, partial [Hemibagrus guttatus]